LTGSAHEAQLTAAVARAMRAPAVDLAGRTSLGAMGALLSRARLLVTNDTGISHLAAALRVPSVVVFTASDPARWAPLDARLHRRVAVHPIECRPCGHKLCPVGHPCSLGIEPRQVLAAVEGLLGEERAHAA
jgi:ADP-heptose:LPS heptosyltransferase